MGATIKLKNQNIREVKNGGLCKNTPFPRVGLSLCLWAGGQMMSLGEGGSTLFGNEQANTIKMQQPTSFHCFSSGDGSAGNGHDLAGVVECDRVWRWQKLFKWGDVAAGI
jgi:hypothetical protein